MHGNAVCKTNLHFLGFAFVGGFLFVWVCHITWRNTETVLKWNSFCFRKGVRSPKQTLMGYPKQSRGEIRRFMHIPHEQCQNLDYLLYIRDYTTQLQYISVSIGIKALQ